MLRPRSLLLTAAAAMTLVACDATDVADTATGPAAADASGGPLPGGAAYVLSDADGPNQVIAFSRASGGRLARTGVFDTGGTGSGGDLGASTDPLALSADGRLLYAVNRGSDDVSVFLVTAEGLVLRQVVPSGGAGPLSVAVSEDLVYVLNTGRDGEGGNVAAFSRGRDGSLEALGTADLPDSATGTVQVGFDPALSVALVSDRPSNTILAFPIQADGTPGEPTVNASVGQTPFGFDFDDAGRLFVSEAVGGEAGASTVSGYTLAGTSTTVIPGASAVPTEETAACWLDASGSYLYTTNTADNTISGFLIAPDGSLSLLNADGIAATTGNAPRDLNTVGDFVYAQSDGQIDVYEIERGTGALSPIQTVRVPATARGVAAR